MALVRGMRCFCRLGLEAHLHPIPHCTKMSLVLSLPNLFPTLLKLFVFLNSTFQANSIKKMTNS